MISLAIGIGALSVTLALVSGFEWTLGRAVQESSGHVIHSFGRWQNYEQLEKFVAAAPKGVERAEFFWSSQGLVVGKTGGRGVLIEGRRLAGTTRVDKPLEQVQISLGAPLAKLLGVSKGDKVRILLPGILQGSVEALVTGVLSHGIYEMDSRLVRVDDQSLRAYLKQKDPQTFATRPGDAHGIRYYLDPAIYSPTHMEALEKWKASYEAMARTLDPEEGIHRFVHWRDAKSPLFRGIDYNKKELSLVIGILTLVAALNIAATLVVLFLERDREVAILQALGMGPRDVLQWVGIQGVLLGVLSSLLGLGLGRAFGWILVRAPFIKIPEDIYNISQLPLKFDFVEQGSIFLFGTLASVGVALFLGIGLGRMNLLSVLGTRR